ncbi:MAG: GNAT family N-acetyltransferase [Chitinophagaceae bacterium]
MKGSTTHIVFETDRLLVRHYTEADADNFFLLNSDPEVMRYIRPVKSREDTDLFFAEVIGYSKNNPAFGRMAVVEKQSDIFIGSFAIIPLEKTVHMQLGYSLLPSYWGKGFATELTKAGLKYVFTQTNLEEIFGITESGNTDSQKVLLKSGLTLHSTLMEGTKELCRFILLKKDFKI